MVVKLIFRGTHNSLNLKFSELSRPRLAVRYQANSEFQCCDIILDASGSIDHTRSKRGGEVVLNRVGTNCLIKIET